MGQTGLTQSVEPPAADYHPEHLRLWPFDNEVVPDRHSNAEFDQSGVNFLIADLDTALTFMDLACTSAVEETVQRNHENARKAYETILRFLEKVALDETRGRMIRSKLALLKERLQAAGYEV